VNFSIKVHDLSRARIEFFSCLNYGHRKEPTNLMCSIEVRETLRSLERLRAEIKRDRIGKRIEEGIGETKLAVGHWDACLELGFVMTPAESPTNRSDKYARDGLNKLWPCHQI
jgi:hypothetical protein